MSDAKPAVPIRDLPCFCASESDPEVEIRAVGIDRRLCFLSVHAKVGEQRAEEAEMVFHSREQAMRVLRKALALLDADRRSPGLVH